MLSLHGWVKCTGMYIYNLKLRARIKSQKPCTLKSKQNHFKKHTKNIQKIFKKYSKDIQKNITEKHETTNTNNNILKLKLKLKPKKQTQVGKLCTSRGNILLRGRFKTYINTYIHTHTYTHTHTHIHTHRKIPTLPQTKFNQVNVF